MTFLDSRKPDYGRIADLEHELYIEPFIGWRSWLLKASGPQLLLVSPQQKAVWPAGRPFEAKCKLRKHHTPPGDCCGCGVYAAKSLEHLQDIRYNDTRLYGVIGQVALYGQVVEAELGWRAQKAYPHHLYVPFSRASWLKPLKETYGVPVSFLNPYQKEALRGK